VGLTISKEEIDKLPIEKFNGKIMVIDNADKVQDALSYLSSQPVLGFDTETKPAFKRGQVHKVALLQLATEEACFLFRLNLIGYPDGLEAIISDPGIRKIGLSLRDDFAAIYKRSARKPENFIDLQVFVDKFGIDDNSLQKYTRFCLAGKYPKSAPLKLGSSYTIHRATVVCGYRRLGMSAHL